MDRLWDCEKFDKLAMHGRRKSTTNSSSTNKATTIGTMPCRQTLASVTIELIGKLLSSMQF
ncbi:hypothetical protein T4E_730 [Trichinella pseudospiralis]|uniref:Uncharacterized protein n=1 Tax=Trichinella pseudospiralis TaxID=6337 RepID=A0A0V0XSF2_TRIPS|nr:hypothetical protein T4E_730 [Trichinella pseudospiralis]